MRAIITGGSGLIGRALTKHLTDEGYEVIVLSRSPGRVTGLPENARAIGWDASSADGWGELAEGVDAIVNLAGESIGGYRFLPTRWTPEQRQRILQSRLNTAHAVVEAVEKAADKPKAVIQSSAAGYYGTHGDEIITEEHPPGDDFLARVCIEWEAASERVEALGVRRAVVRTGIVLSTKGGTLPRVLLPYKLFVGGRYGSGEQWWPWIHIEDTARVIRFLIENENAGGPFNMVAPNPVKNKEFGKTLASILGRPNLIPVPGFAMRALLGQVAMVALEGQRVIPERLLELGFEFCYPTLEPALRDLLERQI